MKKFNYIAPFNNTGYGVASVAYGNNLAINNNYIHASSIGQLSNSEINTNLKICIDRGIDPNLPSFCFWHLFDIPNRLKDVKGKKVAFTTFEIDCLKEEEIKILHLFEKIGTASQWGADILKKYLPEEKVFVVNHAGYEESAKLFNLNRDRSVFFTLWDKLLYPVALDPNSLILSTAGKFESRKAHPELIRACMKADFPIILIAFVHNPFIQDFYPYSFINDCNLYPSFTKSGIKVYTHNKFTLVMMPPTTNKLELHSALSKADYFISPSKAEGWNLPLFEMMSIGMPCITTNYSAHTEYVNKNNSILVNFDNLIPALDNMFFNGVGNWANITESNILDAIIYAKNKLNDNNFIKSLATNANKDTKKITWQDQATKIQKIMNNL